MHLRRFTRLTNGFSQKLENLKAAVSLFTAWYNFCRVHQTWRVTPAMEAQLTDHVWTIRELLTGLNLLSYGDNLDGRRRRYGHEIRGQHYLNTQSRRICYIVNK